VLDAFVRPCNTHSLDPLLRNLHKKPAADEETPSMSAETIEAAVRKVLAESTDSDESLVASEFFEELVASQKQQVIIASIAFH